jgi:hypothetical protein
VARELTASELPRRRRVFHRCSCGRPIPEGVSRCSSRTCPEFAPTWARDTRRRLLENLRMVPYAVMFTVTAPGSDVYPFDPELCVRRPVHRCSGAIGCRVNPEAARDFNRRSGKWWSELHRAAKVRADRATGYKGRIAALAWEKQKRGLAHVHGVLSAGSPAELRWAKAYVEALREMAQPKGFGFVDGWHKVGRKLWPGEQAGAYLSSYFVRGRGGKASITENVRSGDLPRLVVFVGRHLTTVTFCTMRNLRLVRRVWCWQIGRAQPPSVSEWDLLVASCLLARVAVPARAGPLLKERDSNGRDGTGNGTADGRSRNGTVVKPCGGLLGR